MSQKRKPETQSGKHTKKQQTSTSRPPPPPEKQSDSSDEEKLRQAALQSLKHTKKPQTSTSRPPPPPTEQSDSSDEEQLRQAALMSRAAHQKQQTGAGQSGASTSVSPTHSGQQKQDQRRTDQLLGQFGAQYGYTTTGPSPQHISGKSGEQSNIGIEMPAPRYARTPATTAQPRVTSQMVKSCFVRKFIQQKGMNNLQSCLFINPEKYESKQQHSEYCVPLKQDPHPWYFVISSVWFVAERTSFTTYITSIVNIECGFHLLVDWIGVLTAVSLFPGEANAKELSARVLKINCIYPYSVERRVSFGVMIVSKFKDTGLRRWYYAGRDNTRGIWDLSDTSIPYVIQCRQSNRFTTDDNYWAILLDINTKFVMIDLTELGFVGSRKNYTLFLGGTVIILEGYLRFRFPDICHTYDLNGLKNAKIVKDMRQMNKLVFFLKPLTSVNDSLLWSLYIDHDLHERQTLIQRRAGIFYFPGRDSIRNVLFTDNWDKGLECVQWYQSRCDWTQTIQFVDYRTNPFPQPFARQSKPTQIKFSPLWSGLPTNQWSLH